MQPAIIKSCLKIYVASLILIIELNKNLLSSMPEMSSRGGVVLRTVVAEAERSTTFK